MRRRAAALCLAPCIHGAHATLVASVIRKVIWWGVQRGGSPSAAGGKNMLQFYKKSEIPAYYIGTKI